MSFDRTATTGKEMARLAHENQVSRVAFSPDGCRGSRRGHRPRALRSCLASRRGRRPGPRPFRCARRPTIGSGKGQTGTRVAHASAPPDSCSAAERSDYSKTSSARAMSVGEIVRPSAFAVLRLMMSSNLVGCWIGRSAGLAPLRNRLACGRKLSTQADWVGSRS